MGKKNAAVDRIPTGIVGLDRLIGGGFIVLVRGDSGSGKTLFCLQYLCKGASSEDEPGLYISLSEPEKTIRKHGTQFGWDVESLEKKNKLSILKYEPHEVVNLLASGGGSLRDTVESMGATRLVIDSLTAYEMVFESQYKANESVLDLFDMLKKWDVTALVTSEYPVSPNHDGGERLGFLTDGIINLYHMRNRTHRLRALEIIKMRDTHHDNRINIFEIRKGGLRVNGRLNRIER
jgi:KaiC/GvpD/RAD55 family RecA-like ATPase